MKRKEQRTKNVSRFSSYRLVFAVGFLFCTPAAWSQPTVDIGGIMTVNYINGGDGNSPLVHNDGLPGFELIGDLFVNLRVSDEATVFVELETSRGWDVQLYSGSLTYKISKERLKAEAGKFVAPFGNFLPRRFAPQNFLYGFPLHYEYRTGLATNDVPENNQELLHARGSGSGDYDIPGEPIHADYLRHSSSGNRLQKPAAGGIVVPAQPASGHIIVGSDGVKMIAKQTYISGVQLFGKFNGLGYSLGLANGALCYPTDLSVSQRPMVFGRLHVQPLIGLALGLSGASGTYLHHKLVKDKYPDLQPEKYAQHIAGVDVEYSRGYVVFFGEGAFSRWKSPFIRESLDALAFTAEMRYKILPRFYVAARYGRINFSEIADSQDFDADGKLSEPWEFPIWRLESGVGCHLSRHAIVKAVWQINRTDSDGAGDPGDNLAVIQMTVFY
jgi:hypothetical protein